MKPDRRIFILSELYFPEQTSTGYLLTKIAECLGTEYNVKVITGPLLIFSIKPVAQIMKL